MDKRVRARYCFGGEFAKYRDLFAGLCPEPMKLNRGMAVCRQGITRDWMYYLCEGRMRVSACNAEGNERVLAFLEKDTLFGLDCFLPGELSMLSVEPIGRCEVVPLRREALEELLRKKPDLAVDLAGFYCKVLRQLCFDAELQSMNNIFSRIVNYLLASRDALGSDKLPLTQTEIAGAVNCSRSSVSRAMGRMKEAGVIEPEGIGLRILDADGMIDLCKEL